MKKYAKIHPPPPCYIIQEKACYLTSKFFFLFFSFLFCVQKYVNKHYGLFITLFRITFATK